MYQWVTTVFFLFYKTGMKPCIRVLVEYLLWKVAVYVHMCEYLGENERGIMMDGFLEGDVPK